MNSKIKNILKGNYNLEYLGNLLDIDSNTLKNFKNKRGIYIIVSKNTNFIYPEGKSNIIYIGMSKNLNRRIVAHKKNVEYINSLSLEEKREQWNYIRYHYMSKFGARVYIIKCIGNTNEKNLERDIIGFFYDEYFAIPVGNGAFSFGK